MVTARFEMGWLLGLEVAVEDALGGPGVAATIEAHPDLARRTWWDIVVRSTLTYVRSHPPAPCWGPDGDRLAERIELLGALLPPGPSPHARRRAGAFLEQALADGPLPQEVLAGAAAELGISLPTLRRAARQLGVRRYQRGRRWWWGVGPSVRRNRTANLIT